MAQEIFKNKQLPFSIEAERAVLGGIMLKNEAWDLVHVVIREDDFYKDEHKLIFKTIYNLQDEGLNTIEANEALGHQSDSRSYEVAARILKDLEIPVIRLMTNNPLKVEALEALGITVKERIPLVIEARPENAGYLEVKRAVMGHYLG